jgi:hypothetical protein
MPTRADRGFERYNPDDNMMYIGGVGDVPRNLGVEVSKKLFAPRFGLAYRATDTFVVRAGYGISYDPYSLSRPLRTNHPILIELVVPSANSLRRQGSCGRNPALVPRAWSRVIPILQCPRNPFRKKGLYQSWNLTLQKETIGLCGRSRLRRDTPDPPD